MTIIYVWNPEHSPIVVRTVDEKKTAFNVVHFAGSCVDDGIIDNPASKESCRTDSYLCNSNEINISKFRRFVLLTMVFIKCCRLVANVLLKKFIREISAGCSKRLNIWKGNKICILILWLYCVSFYS